MKSVIFMGCPDFAIPALNALINNKHYHVKSIYTKSPSVSGRGFRVNKTPVHILGEQNEIEVLTPFTLKGHTIQEVDIVVLVAYGLLIPQHILDAPKYGCINIHPSLLPRWRGASPIESAILAGDEFTGISIIKMNEHLDEGDIFYTKKIAINNNDYLQLHDRLSAIGAESLMEVLDNISDIEPNPQSSSGITYAKKIQKSLIDWDKSADYIEREIRAFSGKSFYFKGKLLKILSAEFLMIDHLFKNGTIINNELHIACSGSVLIPTVVQPDGKKPMVIRDFLNGLKSL